MRRTGGEGPCCGRLGEGGPKVVLARGKAGGG